MTSPTTGIAPPTDLPKSVRAGIALVGVAAAVLSFDALRQLAIVCGTEERIAFLLPVAVDLAAAVSTVLWLRARRGDVVELARRIAWSTIAASVVGNGLQHYLVADRVAPHWTLVVAVGSVPAAILGAIVHLAVVASSPERTTATTPATALDHPLISEDVPEPPVSEEAAETREPVVDQPATVELGPVHGPPTLVDYLRELDELPSERELARDLSTDHARVSRHAARMILLEVRPGLRAVAA